MVLFSIILGVIWSIYITLTRTKRTHSLSNVWEYAHPPISALCLYTS